MRTYTVYMNITLSIDEQLVERAREKLRATGKTINQEIREHLQHIAGEDALELERDLEMFKQRVGQGNSNGWKWNRDELYTKNESDGRKSAGAVFRPDVRLARTFLDSNILVYAEDSAAPVKQKKAFDLIVEHGSKRTGVVSLQVLGEYFFAATRKIHLDPGTARSQVGVLLLRHSPCRTHRIGCPRCNRFAPLAPLLLLGLAHTSMCNPIRLSRAAFRGHAAWPGL